MAQKIDIICYVESHYPISTKILKQAVQEAIKSGPSRADMIINVSVIGDRKMRQLNQQYRGHDKTTDVLSFSYAESLTPDEKNMHKIHLGEVVLSYPEVLKRAAADDALVDETAQFLVVHGVLHLLGYDHEGSYEAYQMENLEDKIMENISKVKKVGKK